MKNPKSMPNPILAAAITKAASKQTYYTVRFLVDRPLQQDAYLAYAYFRWVDDRLDAETGSRAERLAFLQRQKSILDGCYKGELPQTHGAEEGMLVDLVQRNPCPDSGLRIYLQDMMAVMEFYARRRGRLVSQQELSTYTHNLASAVTEAMHYFIGNTCGAPHDETRYLAVTAAHITHMLRDTFDDVQAGYYNIPREVLEAHHIRPKDVQSRAYRAWVRSRVELARAYFKTGRSYLRRVECLRCRVAGYAYMARFEWLLSKIEREGYRLRPEYNERKNLGTALRMSWLILTSMTDLREADIVGQPSQDIHY